MKLLVMLLVCASVLAAQVPVTGGLRVIVIDGDEAANIVAEKIAAEPVIEVRDEQNRRVAGAVVRFTVRRTMRDRVAALFRNGEAEVRTLTDAAGQARATSVTPLEAGSFDIVVQVSHQGRTASATLRQTNYSTVAEAQAAGRKPGQSSGASASTPAGVSAGGGLSSLAVIGLAVGGAAGGGAALIRSQRGAAAPSAVPARVTGVTATQGAGVQAATPFAFGVQVADFDAASLTYRWEFGDGATSTDPTPTHVYELPGTYPVTVTVADARHSARAEMSVTVYTVSGTWVSPDGRITFQITQTGNEVGAESAIQSLLGGGGLGPFYPRCISFGSVQRGSPAIITIISPRCTNSEGSTLRSAEFRLEMAPDGRRMTGTITEADRSPAAFSLQRQ